MRKLASLGLIYGLIVVQIMLVCVCAYHVIDSQYKLHYMQYDTNTHAIEFVWPEQLQAQPEIFFEVLVTAYSSEPEQTDSTPFIAAWGDKVHDGMLAVSRDLERLGLRRNIRVELLGREFIIQDRMHRRKKCQIDIWMRSKKAAIKFGRQRHMIRVIDPDKIIWQLLHKIKLVLV